MTKELLQQCLDALKSCRNVDQQWQIFDPQKVLKAVTDITVALAQQEQPASVDAYIGAREDAAIWKKRALEAEELNRKFIADVNGPTYLGEPVKQEQPAERDGIPEWTPAIGIECAISSLRDDAARLRDGSYAPLQIADDLDVIATDLAECLPVAQPGAQS